ncbi:hypothetical protein ACYOEI_09910 [Singulisphaera rosea]
MAASRSTFSRSGVRFSALATMIFGLGHVALGQDHTPDPYKPYNAAYESFVYPVYPTDGYYPNQSVLSGQTSMSRANQFQDFLDDLDGAGRSSQGGRRRGGLGTPYYEASRDAYDPKAGRGGSSSAARDDQFYSDRQARHDSYINYLRERDPKKRAELYREFTQGSSRLSRELSSVRNRPEPPFAKKSATNRPSTESGALRSTMTKRGVNSRLRGLDSPSARRGSDSKRESPTDILKRSKELESRRTTSPSPSGFKPRPTAPTSLTAPR